MVTCRELCRVEQCLPAWTLIWQESCSRSPHLLAHFRRCACAMPLTPASSLLIMVIFPNSPSWHFPPPLGTYTGWHQGMTGLQTLYEDKDTWEVNECFNCRPEQYTSLIVKWLVPPLYSDGHALICRLLFCLIAIPEPFHKQANVWIQLYGCRRVYSDDPTWSSPCEGVRAGSVAVTSQARG